MLPQIFIITTISALLTLITAVPNAASTTIAISHTPVTRPQISHTTVAPTQTSKDQQYGPTPTCTQTITPDKNGYVPPNTCGALYDFYPSFGAAIAASVFFGIVTIAHIVQAIVHKKKFCWVIIMAAFWELASFITRTLGTRHQQSSGLQMISQLLVLLAPLWVNAFSYMLLARMVYFFIPSQKLLGIKASTFAVTFVSFDIVSFVIQLIGGGMAGNDQPVAQQMHGIHIYMGGIGLQEFFIALFVGLAVKFEAEMLKMERVGRLPFEKQRWRGLLWTLYAELGLISIRIIFRLAEFSKGAGPSNPAPYHEAYFYVFEALPMFLAIVALNITHPGTVLQGPDSEIPRSRIFRKCCTGRKKENRMAKKESEYDMPLCKAPAEISVAPVPTDGYWRG